MPLQTWPSLQAASPIDVSRDVSKLSELGFVEVESVSNEGYERKKVVMPAAGTISINVSIAVA